MSTPKVLLQTKYLEDAETTQYTAPASVRAVRVDEFIIANRTGAAGTVTVRVVPSGGTAGPEHELFPAVSIGANSIWQAPPFWLGPGDFIRTDPSAASTMVARIGGREFTS